MVKVNSKALIVPQEVIKDRVKQGEKREKIIHYYDK